MRRLAALGLAGLLLLLLVGARGHSAAVCASGTATVRFAGRSLIVHIPPAAGRTLLIALHGYRGSPAQMERYTGFDALADRDGFVVAYPAAAGTFWNSNAARRLPDDVTYLAGLVDHLAAQLCTHPDRTVLAGVSNGGGMAALAACRLAGPAAMRTGRVVGLASVAGGYDGQPPCRPAHPLPVLEIHGTADPVVPYFGARRRPTSDGLPPFVGAWLRLDRCATRPQRSRLSRRSLRLRFTPCAAQTFVEHVRITGGRHQWPGATPADPGPRAGFSASAEVARFVVSAAVIGS